MHRDDGRREGQRLGRGPEAEPDVQPDAGRREGAGRVPAGTTDATLAGIRTCFGERSSIRAQITDLSPVEGELVTDTSRTKGRVVGVEGGSTVVFYPYDFSSPSDVRRLGRGRAKRRDPAEAGDDQSLQTYAFWSRGYRAVLVRNRATSGTASLGTRTLPSRARWGSAYDRSTACCVGRIGCKPVQGSRQRNLRPGVRYEPQLLLAYVFDAVAGPGGHTRECGMFLAVLGPRLIRPTAWPFLLALPSTSPVHGRHPGKLGGCDFLGDSDDGNNYPAVRMYEVKLEPGSPTELAGLQGRGHSGLPLRSSSRHP